MPKRGACCIILKVTRNAMIHPERHWSCIMDEMNLVRVEQYLAEVLSLMEDRHPIPQGEFERGIYPICNLRERF